MKGRYGGSAIYVKDDPNLTVQFSNSYSPSKDCNICLVIINNVTIINCYRSPNQTNDNFKKFIDFIKKLDYPNLVITGDLNLPGITWKTFKGKGHLLQEAADVFHNLGCINYVEDTTHVKGGLLDVVLGQFGRVLNTQVWSNLSFPSDHFPVSFQLACDKPNTTKRIIKMYKDFQSDMYKMKLAEVDWYAIDYNDLDQATERITKTILKIYEECLPTKTLSHNRSLDKFPPRIVTQIKLCQKFRKEDSLKKLRAAQLILNDYISEWKMQNVSRYLDGLESSKNNIYSVFRKHQFKSMVTCTRNKQNEIVFDPKQVASILNEFFAETLTVSSEVNLDWSDQENLLIEDIDISETLVIETIMKTKRSNGVGPDSLSVAMLLEGAQQIAFPLTMLFRRILATGYVPKNFRNACVCPIPKKADSSYPNHVRGICKESVAGKVLERIVQQKLYTTLESVDYFPDSQFGFRKGRGCVQNLELFHDYLHRSLEEGFQVAVCFADLSKAFDVVDHGLVLQAVHSAGIRGRLGTFLQAWLHDRKQFVKFKNEESETIDVKSSIIQGSNLATLLFLCLKNNLHKYIKHCLIIDFADDTKLAFKYKSTEELWAFENDIRNLQQWAEDVKQVLNMTKTVVINFGSILTTNIYVNNNLIKVTDSIKDLGITISGRDAFKEHYEILNRKMSLATHAAKKSIKGASFSVRSFVWSTYIVPIMKFAVSIWADEKIGEELDKHFKSLFEDSHPSDGDVIPLTPSQELLRETLRKCLKCQEECKHIKGQFYRLTTGKEPNLCLRAHTDSILIPSLPIIEHDWPAKSFFQRARLPWNKLVGQKSIVNQSDIEKFVRSNESGCAGVELYEKLCKGVLRSQYKKMKELRAEQQQQLLNASF